MILHLKYVTLYLNCASSIPMFAVQFFRSGRCLSDHIFDSHDFADLSSVGIIRRNLILISKYWELRGEKS